MIDLSAKLPFWLGGTQIKRAALALAVWWGRAETWLNDAAAQASIATCTDEALAAHARDRAIVRLPGESAATWRARTQHALTTVVEAGSYKGLETILTTFGVVGFSILERVPGQDWDIIEIRLEPTALNGADTILLDRIFHKWGRVCRRYTITHIDPAQNYVTASEVTELQHVEVAA